MFVVNSTNSRYNGISTYQVVTLVSWFIHVPWGINSFSVQMLKRAGVPKQTPFWLFYFFYKYKL